MKFNIKTNVILDYTQNKNIMIYLILRFNKDIAEHIFNYYKKFILNIKEYHIYLYNLLKPIPSMVDYTTHVLPYYKNDIFDHYSQYNKYIKVLTNKKYCLWIIQMIGHQDFIGKTNLNLKHKCNDLTYHLYGEDNQKWKDDIERLINIEKGKLNIWKKIKTIECIIKIADYLEYGVNTKWEGNWNYNIYEIMYNNYKYYININELYVPGYIVDKNGIVYGI
tara:strand:+ start:1128 stop:1790 length:663 start_codon:yes stop_codon:yes gene_type:complete